MRVTLREQNDNSKKVISHNFVTVKQKEHEKT